MSFTIKSLKQYIFNRFKENESRIHELRYLFWECTLRCNLNCKHCGSDCGISSSVNDMSKETFLEQAREIARSFSPNLITIVFTGGEPLLRDDLEEVGKEVRRMGFHWGIVTNGMAYTPERHKRLMGAGMGSVTLSIDGLEIEHNWLRNSDKSFSNAIKALDILVLEPRLNFDVVTCVNPQNLPRINELGYFLSEKKLKAWRLFTIAPKGRAVGNDDLLLNHLQQRGLMEFIKANRKIGNMKVNFSCEGYVGPYEAEVRDGFFFCRAGIHIGSILADGSVNACPNIDRTMAQGNIYTNSFSEIWRNSFDIMRNRNWTKTGICSDCKEYQNCQGSAMHLWDFKKKELLHCHSKALQ